MVAAWLITVAQLPQQLAATLEPLIDSPRLPMLVIMLLVLAVGMVMDLSPTILILVPLLMPVVKLAGIDPVYFGILLTINLAIGANTPPLGIDLMAACRVGGIPMSRAFGYLVPFLGVMIAVLVFLVFVPWIVTDLPHLIF